MIWGKGSGVGGWMFGADDWKQLELGVARNANPQARGSHVSDTAMAPWYRGAGERKTRPTGT